MPSIARYEERPRPGRRRRVLLRVAAALALALLAARLLLPFAAVRIANARLAGLDGVSGRIGAADFRVARGGFALDDVVLRRDDAEGGALRVEADRIDVSFSWIQIARGRVSAEVVVERPLVFYSAGPGDEEPPEPAEDPREIVARARPFHLSRFEIVDGAARLEWPVGQRTQRLVLTGVNARFAGLGNHPETGPGAVATGRIEARLPGGGLVTAEAEGAPLARPPRVRARAEIAELDLRLLNPILLEALGADVSKGSLRMTADFRAAEGYYEGQVTALMRDARFTRPAEERASFGEGARAAILDVAASVLRNDETERVASQVPFSGRFGDGEVDGWTAFTTLLRNAFGEALRAGRIDGD
jgi:hypothetical protein